MLAVLCATCLTPAPLAAQAAQMSEAERNARETAYVASRAVKALYEFFDYQKADGLSIEFRNVTTSSMRVNIYNATDNVMAIAAATSTLASRSAWRHTTLTQGSTVNVRVFRGLSPIHCAERKGVRSPAIVNLTGTCGVTVLPVRQTVPPSLQPYGITANFLGRHHAYPQKLSYIIAQGGKYLFVAFLGTDSIPENLVMNLAAARVRNNPMFSGVEVHAGWATAINTIYPDLYPRIRAWQGNRTLVVTGFSMGGALAGYLTYVLMADANVGPIWLATFGSPRYATAEFKAAFDRRASTKRPRAYSIELEGDPKLLLWPKGFRDVSPVLGFEVFRTGQAVDYLCSETLHLGNCLSKNPESGPHNHRFYEEAAQTRWSAATAAALSSEGRASYLVR
jgi:hypothetical protein